MSMMFSGSAVVDFAKRAISLSSEGGKALVLPQVDRIIVNLKYGCDIASKIWIDQSGTDHSPAELCHPYVSQAAGPRYLANTISSPAGITQ
jgi:hypothetical protein